MIFQILTPYCAAMCLSSSPGFTVSVLVNRVVGEATGVAVKIQGKRAIPRRLSERC